MSKKCVSMGYKSLLLKHLCVRLWVRKMNREGEWEPFHLMAYFSDARTDWARLQPTAKSPIQVSLWVPGIKYLSLWPPRALICRKLRSGEEPGGLKPMHSDGECRLITSIHHQTKCCLLLGDALGVPMWFFILRALLILPPVVNLKVLCKFRR